MKTTKTYLRNADYGQGTTVVILKSDTYPGLREFIV